MVIYSGREKSDQDMVVLSGLERRWLAQYVNSCKGKGQKVNWKEIRSIKCYSNYAVNTLLAVVKTENKYRDKRLQLLIAATSATQAGSQAHQDEAVVQVSQAQEPQEEHVEAAIQAPQLEAIEEPSIQLKTREARIAELEEELMSRDNAIEGLQLTLKKFEDQIVDLQEKLKSRDQVIIELQQKISYDSEQQQRLMDERQEKIDREVEHNKELQVALTKLTNKEAEWLADRDRAREDARLANIENARLLEELHSRDRELGKLADDYRELRRQEMQDQDKMQEMHQEISRLEECERIGVFEDLRRKYEFARSCLRKLDWCTYIDKMLRDIGRIHHMKEDEILGVVSKQACKDLRVFYKYIKNEPNEAHAACKQMEVLHEDWKEKRNKICHEYRAYERVEMNAAEYEQLLNQAIEGARWKPG